MIKEQQYKVKIAKDIEQILIDKINEHRKEFYDSPIAVLLGPHEYAALMASFNTKLGRATNLVFPEIYYGLPIRLKKSDGIDLEVPVKDVFKYLKIERVENESR